jgi:death-on-curing protein
VTCYPSVEEVLAVHVLLVERFGGAHGVRDRSALESAVARAQSGYYEDRIQEAAALWESLSQNHPFIDGNKRTAVTVAAAFLRANGYKLRFDDQAAFAFLIELYEMGRMRFGELDAWLREHVSPLGG